MINPLFVASTLHAAKEEATSRGAAEAAAESARRAQDSAELLKHDVERLYLITKALWTIVREQLEYPDEELARRINEIDAADGALDGKIAASPPMQCPHCQRTVQRKRARCLYCGGEIQTDPFQR